MLHNTVILLFMTIYVNQQSIYFKGAVGFMSTEDNWEKNRNFFLNKKIPKKTKENKYLFYYARDNTDALFLFLLQ